MGAATGMTVVKRFTYRGDATEEWSNTYWFTGSPPGDNAAWRALFDALTTAEKTVYPSTTQIIRGYGYNDDTGHKPDDTGSVSPAAWMVDLTVSPEVVINGTHALGTGIVMPGDSAVWIRLKTSRVTSPGGKAIYLRKYFHPAITASGLPDTVTSTHKAALTAFATKLQDGTLIGTRKLTTAGKTDVITSVGASSYATTRTLKRRGKRPGS